MGHEVTMITSYVQPHDDNKWFKTFESGINIYWLPLNIQTIRVFERIKVFLIFSWKSFFKIKDIDGDLIFASSTPLTIALPAIFISKKKNIPMVFE